MIKRVFCHAFSNLETIPTVTYDANGNNTVATDRNGLTVTMEYDKLDRLTKKTYPDGSLTNTYEYDSVSNRTKKTTTKTCDISKLADRT